MSNIGDWMGGWWWVVTIANNNATLWPYLTIKDLSDFPLWMEKKIGPTVAIYYLLLYLILILCEPFQSISYLKSSIFKNAYLNPVQFDPKNIKITLNPINHGLGIPAVTWAGVGFHNPIEIPF